MVTNLSEQSRSRTHAWRAYYEAELGFRNHWYPILFSHELDRGGFQGVRLLGERILLGRVDDKVYAVEDRCVHRGVPFSRKPECYAKGTITCWYHGFTYKLETGELCDIITEPDSKLIGKASLKTYPVREEKGMIFVFVGDMDPPPDLREDVPPTFLDPDMCIRGIRRPVQSNWRLGCENGFDSTHVYIHRNSKLVRGNDLQLPLGLLPVEKTWEWSCEDQGPKGVIETFFRDGQPLVNPVFETTVQGNKVTTEGAKGSIRVPDNISIWLPCVLRVQPWPIYETTQFEWYVPVDERSHMYIAVLGKRVNSPEEAERFQMEVDVKWSYLALRGFNDDDIWAREAMQEFYEKENGWERERLFKPDAAIVEWRKLASRYNRGIQRPNRG